jgi:glycosyltransferase involved in cell wall biosynthesis
MPTFNRAHLISKTIKSCLDQTYANFELIIVDDCSTDNTVEVISRIQDKRIIFIRSQDHIGRSKARNKGLAISKGEFISFIDSDDLYLPSKLSQDLKILGSSAKALAVYTSATCIDLNTEKIIQINRATKSGNLYDDCAFFLPLIIATSQVTIAREVYLQVGKFDELLDRFEDTDYFRRVSMVTEWAANPECLVVLQNHSDNVISNQSQKTILTMLQVYVSKVKKEILENSLQGELSPTKLYVYYAQALFLQSNGITNSLKLYCTAIKEDPKATLKVLLSIIKMVKNKLIVFINQALKST